MDLSKYVNLLNPVLIFILYVIVFSSKSYIKTLFEEKAKSDIKKRDIEELTQKMESVKAIYSKENELIKHQLNQLLILKEHHRDEERNALIKFHAAYIRWIYLFQSINLADYNTQNLTELLEKKLSLNNFFYDIQVARANVLLIVTNDQIVKKTYELIQKLIDYKSFIEKNLLSLQFLLDENNGIMKSFLEHFKFDEKYRPLLEKLANADTENRKKAEKLKQDYQESRTPEFLKCRYICDEFAELTKKYLTSIDL